MKSKIGGSSKCAQCDSYLYWQFNYPENEIDYQDYRTFLRVTGVKKREDDYLQETDTISRLVYGFASAYLMTGEDRSKKRC